MFRGPVVKPTTSSIFAISSLSEKFAGPWMPLLTLSAITLLKKTGFLEMDFVTASFPFAEPKFVKHADLTRHFRFRFSDLSQDAGSILIGCCYFMLQ